MASHFGTPCIAYMFNWIDLMILLRCGQETRVIPRILQLRSHWLKSEKESVRLEEAGITKEVNQIDHRVIGE